MCTRARHDSSEEKEKSTYPTRKEKPRPEHILRLQDHDLREHEQHERAHPGYIQHDHTTTIIISVQRSQQEPAEHSPRGATSNTFFG